MYPHEVHLDSDQVSQRYRRVNKKAKLRDDGEQGKHFFLELNSNRDHTIPSMPGLYTLCYKHFADAWRRGGSRASRRMTELTLRKAPLACPY